MTWLPTNPEPPVTNTVAIKLLSARQRDVYRCILQAATKVYRCRVMKRPTRRGAAPVRRRNAAATRAAILTSAREAFARAGYDGAGVREIAKGAGVTAMLVNRYFGSKERLFAEVVADIMSKPIILTGDRLKSPR